VRHSPAHRLAEGIISVIVVTVLWCIVIGAPLTLIVWLMVKLGG
jgi:hypothetical protein